LDKTIVGHLKNHALVTWLFRILSITPLATRYPTSQGPTWLKRFLSGCLLLFLSEEAFCQSSNQPSSSRSSNNPTLKTVATAIPRLSEPIEFDGKIGESEWTSIDTLALVSHWPSFSQKANSRTLLRVAYDDKFFYFSAKCYDNPSMIQGPYFERDMWEMTQDQIAIMLDTYNDNENGLIFVVSPTGSRVDVTMKNDAQGEEPIDLSWNSFWEAKVSESTDGWMMEARIPFSSLRFQVKDEKVTMGFIAYRYIARERQMDIYPSVPPDWGFWSFLKPSKAADVSFTGIRNKRPWFTSPYVLAGAGYHHNFEEGEPYYEKVSDNRLTAGLDVQHALTDNMNLDITVNTDFAQVEADDQVVNLTRFSLFFPEKRRFFLERSSIMEFGFENNNRLFYSRRIGLINGRNVPLLGGARLVGRINNYDVGMMVLQSGEKYGFPSENFGVLRLRRKISKNNSYVGGILTSRTDFNGNTNLAYGVDGIINLFKNDYLKVNLARSDHSLDTMEYSGFLNDRKRIYIMWENRAQVGLNYSLSYSQVDKNYVPGLGFEERNSYKAFGDRVSYGWFPSKESKFRYLRFDVNAKGYFPINANRVESFQVAPSFYMEWPKYNSIQITYSNFHDNPPAAFKLSDDIEISPGSYVNRDVNVTYQSPPVDFLSAVFSATAGSFYGGERFSAAIEPNYIISKYLTLSGFFEYNRINFKDNEDLISYVGRLKIATSLNVKLSVNAFVQMNSLSEVTAINFRLRYNSKDGNDFYFVYNESLNNKGHNDPTMPFSDFRAFIVKYIYTFHLGR
jgi:hypothetical protein